MKDQPDVNKNTAKKSFDEEIDVAMSAATEEREKRIGYGGRDCGGAKSTQQPSLCGFATPPSDPRIIGLAIAAAAAARPAGG